MERNNRNTRTERSTRDEGRDRGSSRDSGRTERSERGGRDTGRDDGRGSSRGTGFQYRKPTAEDVKKRAEQRGGSEFDSIFKSSTKMFKVNDGSNLIRILPPTWPEPKHFGYDIFVHYSVGPDSQTYLCPKEMLGEPCPICEERALAVKDGDDNYAKELKASKRVVLYLIDRDAEKEGVQVWAAPWTVDRDLNTLIVDKRTGEVLGIDDPEHGYDVDFTKNGTGLTTKYIGLQIARRDSDLGKDEWLQYAIDNPIPDQLAYFDYDHIAKVFGGKTTKKDDDLDAKQERGLRGVEDRSTRGSSKPDNTLTFEAIHEMAYEELCAILEDERLEIEPKDSTNDQELADWICEDLNIEKSARKPAREIEADNPRDKLTKMRRERK